MFERILYPTDFSDVSNKALDYIEQLKEVGTKEVIVLHVIDERGIGTVTRFAPGNADAVL
jgi:nucleotide-binding universal stress UspA family protein